MIQIFLAVLATYRIASMLATEEGAFGIFAAIRERIDPEQTTWLGRGLNCPLCIGFWVALAFAAILTCPALPDFIFWRDLMLNWFAIAGGQALLYQAIERG